MERRDEKREEALLRDFGVQLRWLREQRRMTLEDAEARSGVSTSSLSAYERGEGNPTLRTVMLLAESYQVPLSGLLREREREPDCAQAASACLLQCIEAMSGVLRRGATQPELKRCAAECISWLEEILRPDRTAAGRRMRKRRGRRSLGKCETWGTACSPSPACPRRPIRPEPHWRCRNECALG